MSDILCTLLAFITGYMAFDRINLKNKLIGVFGIIISISLLFIVWG